MVHYLTETTLNVTTLGINDVFNTYRFQMERSECEASIMGVPTSHIHFAPKQAQSFHKIYTACCSKTDGSAEGGRHRLSSQVLPRVPGGQGMSRYVTLCHDVSHAGPLTMLMGPLVPH